MLYMPAAAAPMHLVVPLDPWMFLPSFVLDNTTSATDMLHHDRCTGERGVAVFGRGYQFDGTGGVRATPAPVLGALFAFAFTVLQVVNSRGCKLLLI